MRAANQDWILAALLAAALLWIGFPETPEASAETSDSSLSGEVTPPSSFPEGEPDLLFDEELERDLDSQPVGFPDPWERTNRGMLAFNNQVDRYLLNPITAAYGFVFPGPVKRAIRRAVENVDEPSTMINDILQLEWGDSLRCAARLLVNSTVGIGGLFDPASRWGLRPHRSDFGQTLALAGTPSGPYLVLPVVGPNTVRGGTGYLLDSFTRPSFYVTYLVGPVLWVFYEGGSGLTVREAHLVELRALKEGSIDFYAALRSAYYQNRTAQIWSRRKHRRRDWEAQEGEVAAKGCRGTNACDAGAAESR